MSTTLDRDLFLPADAGNLLAAWDLCRDHGFELFAGTEPLDEPARCGAGPLLAEPAPLDKEHRSDES